MATTQKIMHLSVVVLFSIAIMFYLLGLATHALVFGLIGVVVELAAWITWFATASAQKESKGSGG